MTPNIATTKELSARLLQCGVDPETADMCWRTILCPSDNEPWGDPQLLVLPYSAAKDIYAGDYVESAWSLSTLLSLLPKEIYDESDDSFYFSLAKEFPLSEEYGAAYIPCWDKGDAIVRKRDNDPIEACVQLIEWLTANNYKLNQL